MSENVFIGLGSNAGDREGLLCSAVATLSRIDAVGVVRCSSLFESAPVGPPQPRYLNAVVHVECGLSPQRLLGILKQMETDHGRCAAPRWGPRSLDLDILLWDGRVVADGNLQIPHLELHKRRFVLEPLCELAADHRHPILGETMDRLLQRVLQQDVVRLDSDWLGNRSLGADS